MWIFAVLDLSVTHFECLFEPLNGEEEAVLEYFFKNHLKKEIIVFICRIFIFHFLPFNALFLNLNLPARPRKFTKKDLNELCMECAMPNEDERPKKQPFKCKPMKHNDDDDNNITIGGGGAGGGGDE